jgi:hypothetical protein
MPRKPKNKGNYDAIMALEFIAGIERMLFGNLVVSVVVAEAIRGVAAFGLEHGFCRGAGLLGANGEFLAGGVAVVGWRCCAG